MVISYKVVLQDPPDGYFAAPGPSPRSGEYKRDRGRSDAGPGESPGAASAQAIARPHRPHDRFDGPGVAGNGHCFATLAIAHAPGASRNVEAGTTC
jgi:hypothetical protein